MAGHRLSQAERAGLGRLPLAVDCERIRVYRGDARGVRSPVRQVVLALSRGRAIALGNHVFLPSSLDADLAVLAHELTHCGQYQAWGPLRYFTRGAWVQARDLVYRRWGIGASAYGYVLQAGRRFEEYGMEQQGQIVEDAFRGDAIARRVSPFHGGEKTV